LVTAIPRSALLKTAEGTFAYVVNGNYFFRTPIKTGAENADFIEVKEGLYAGDQIVSKPIMTLWVAELQVIKGGGHCH
jgi:multidrug efflux pump subunit AcrA (membrane-fusion protein)